jgi:hypothetical protein
MRHTLVAVFDNRSDAQNALDELLASGFSSTDASLSSADPTGQTDSVSGDNELLTGAHEEGFGASIKHFFTSLFGSDSNEHAARYSDAVTRGHHVLTLTTESEPEVERAADIIERFGPVDIDENHEKWAAGTAGAGTVSSGLQQPGSMSAQSAGTGSGSQQRAGPDSLQYSANEDRNFFGTQNSNDTVPKGNTYQEPLGRSQGGSLGQGRSTLQGTASIPGSDDASLGGTARMDSQSGSLQRDTNQSGSQQRDLGSRGKVRVFSRDAGTSSTYDDYYRSHWDENYSSLGGNYDDYEPAYRYGTEMRRDEKYRDRDWNDVEKSLRSDWETRHPGVSTWEKFKAAIRHGWDRITPDLDSDDWYRSDWNDHYSSLGGSYDDYAPAYRYGTEMRTSARYRDRSWDEVESDLKSDWEARHPGASTWDKFKAAVRRGWDKITPDIDDDSYYRTHWNARYSNANDTYDDYLPAYRYGDEARRLQKYRSRHWNDAESDLKSDWEARYTSGPSTWDKFKDAVRHGWDKITPDMDESTYYHTHYESNYASSGADYDDVEPAYRYGNEMRQSDSFRGRHWDDAETDLKNDWHSRYGAHDERSAWERIKAAVRHGWEKMTGDTDAESHYRTHWSNTYASGGTNYDDYAPAYRYGAEMRNDARYRNSDWADVEDALHADWDTRYGTDGVTTWEKVKAAVRHGWDRAMI